MKKILRYLNGTINLGIMYSRRGNSELIGYVDNDYAGDTDDRKSTEVMCLCWVHEPFHGHPRSKLWSLFPLQKQVVVTLAKMCGSEGS